VSDLHNLPHGPLLHFLSPTHQDRVAAYLTLLRARQYAPSSLEHIITASKSFCLLLPETLRQPIVQDFAHTTPEHVDAWLPRPARPGSGSWGAFLPSCTSQATCPATPFAATAMR
jgi:hypothetical protein